MEISSARASSFVLLSDERQPTRSNMYRMDDVSGSGSSVISGGEVSVSSDASAPDVYKRQVYRSSPTESVPSGRKGIPAPVRERWK